MQGKIVLQFQIYLQAPARGLTRNDLHDLAVDERAEELPRAFAQGFFLGGCFVAIVDQLSHRPAAVGIAAQYEQQQAV